MNHAIANPALELYLSGLSSRRQFFGKMLELPSGGSAHRPPHHLFNLLCDYWSDALNANWSWLWLKNTHTSQWEIVGVGNRHLPQGYAKPFELPEFIEPSRLCVAEIASRRGAPIKVDNVATYAEPLDGVEVTVVLKKWFLQNKVTAMDTIPFRVRSVDKLCSEVVEGVVCCHYESGDQRAFHEVESLMLMAGLTSQAIANQYEQNLFSILFSLNDLAGSYLSKHTKRPDLDRDEYLDHLISLIRQYVGVQATSIFYRDIHLPRATCLRSTGLLSRSATDNQWFLVPPTELNQCFYNTGEGRTGQCLQSGDDCLIPVRKASGVVPKFQEDIAEIEASPGFITAIPRNATLSTPSRQLSCDGVIRCVGHPSPLYPGKHRNFDSLETQTVKFICSQVSPILHTYAARVQRERQISVVKHDLDAPVVMIEGTIQRMRRHLEKGERIPEYRFLDLEMSSVAVKNLSKQLDADPSQIEFHPQKTKLEGEIVAGISSMLRYYANKYAINLEFQSFKETIPPLYVDREAIERVLCNLIVNAIKYGYKGTTVQVVPRRTDEGYAVDVVNYGIGVSQSDAPYVFQPYFRADVAKAKKMGVGLGLYIASSVMQLHGGRLELTQRMNPTIFTMHFPYSLQFPESLRRVNTASPGL